jgi:tRNA/tmRNA/rRNA uracil-C5-methylase (TrmA/RlmC/RlmD family)
VSERGVVGLSAPVELAEGVRVEVSVGQPAHGGHCVARITDAPGADAAGAGLVVFVRHALPGERVVAEITEVHRGYLRADAVEVLEASPDRVTAPCRYAHPDGCGGCDLQHAAVPAQLAWKAAVVREQLLRLAGLTQAEVDNLGVRVTALPPSSGLGWRSRVRYAVDAAGRPGLLKHRSHEVVPVDRCLIAHPAIQDAPVTDRIWPDADSVQVVASATGEVVVLTGPAGGPELVASSGGENAAQPGADGTPESAGLVPFRQASCDEVHERAAGRVWTLPADVFWQVHPAAPDTLATAVVELLAPRPGETAWDLYGGAGLFAAALAAPVGASGHVTLVESAPATAAAARANLADLPQVTVVEARVRSALSAVAGGARTARRGRLPLPVDLVVLDPPRSGAGADIVRAVVAAGPRATAYVACDPAAFARDLRTFREAGWRLVALRAYDCFPMTHHVELVALLAPLS